MPIQSLTPYLTFDGTAGKAIQHYERALGAKVEMMQTFAEVPDMPVPQEHGSRVMHAHLKVGGGSIMISDSQVGVPVTPGTNVHVALQIDELADARAKFDALAAGGKVTMPLQDTFWGATFGMLTDAYGVQWMINCQKKGA